MTTKIPVEWYRKIRDGAITQARNSNICRSLMPVRGPIGGIGVQQWSWDKETEMSQALITYQFVDLTEDQIGWGRDHIAIPLIQKDFRFGRRDLESARIGGYPLSLKNSNAATYQVVNLENEMVIKGFSRDGGNSYDIKGLFTGAGTEISDVYDFATVGNAITAFKVATKTLFDDKFYGPYTAIINQQEWAHLSTNLISGFTSELSIVEKQIGNIMVTDWVPPGEGLVVPPQNESFYELIIAQDFTVETEILPKSRDLWGRMYEALVPVIYQPKSILKLKNIGPHS